MHTENRFENLEVWKDACRIAVLVYENLNECRDYGLKDQMTRSAVSIASNIAEGAERNSVPDFIRFLYYAKGSAAELRTQIYIAQQVGIIPSDRCTEMIQQLKKISGMLYNLIRMKKG